MDPAYKAVLIFILIFVGTVALVVGLRFSRYGVFR
jgi:hypothetical protein